MKTDLELKLQSYLDGEVEAVDTREIEKILAVDPEAKSLLSELSMTRQILKGNEPEVRLNETRDFYFSQIKRRIESAEVQASRSATRSSGWRFRRLLAPIVTGAACIFALVLGVSKYNNQGAAWTPVVIENLASESTSMSFRSPSENMFVVWVSNRDEGTTISDTSEESVHD